jgi:hypothetical protein
MVQDACWLWRSGRVKGEPFAAKSVLAILETFLSWTWDRKMNHTSLALSSNVTGWLFWNTFSLTTEAIRTLVDINKGAVVEKLAKADWLRKSEPIAELKVVAIFQASIFISYKVRWEMEAFDAFSLLKTIFSLTKDSKNYTSFV